MCRASGARPVQLGRRDARDEPTCRHWPDPRPENDHSVSTKSPAAPLRPGQVQPEGLFPVASRIGPRAMQSGGAGTATRDG